MTLFCCCTVDIRPVEKPLSSERIHCKEKKRRPLSKVSGCENNMCGNCSSSNNKNNYTVRPLEKINRLDHEKCQL